MKYDKVRQKNTMTERQKYSTNKMQKDKNTKKKIKRTKTKRQNVKNTVRQKDKNTKRQKEGLRGLLGKFQ